MLNIVILTQKYSAFILFIYSYLYMVIILNNCLMTYHHNHQKLGQSYNHTVEPLDFVEAQFLWINVCKPHKFQTIMKHTIYVISQWIETILSMPGITS